MRDKKLLWGLLLFLSSAPVLAQEDFQLDSTGIAPNTMETWQGQLPVLIIFILIVVAVDAFFIMTTRRNSDQS